MGVVIGINAQILQANAFAHKGMVLTSSIPIGYRGYFKAAKGINISPELWYNIGAIQMGGLNNDYFARPRYIHIGVSARMRIFSGSLYFHSGPLYNFGGFRLGISL